MIEFKDFLECTVLKETSVFKNFDPKSARLDCFLNDFLASDGMKKKLWYCMKVLMVLSHGQASVERGFSINKAIEVENLKQESYIAQRLIFENCSKQSEIHNVIITKEMRKYVTHSRQKYMGYLEEERKKMALADSGRKKKRKIEEVNILKAKRVCLQNNISSLEKSAQDLANKGENIRDISLFIKSNGMRKEIKEKIIEVENLEKIISEKQKEINK